MKLVLSLTKKIMLFVLIDQDRRKKALTLMGKK